LLNAGLIIGNRYIDNKDKIIAYNCINNINNCENERKVVT